MSRRSLRAERWFGATGIEALAPAWLPDPGVMQFYVEAAQGWLNLEEIALDVRFLPPNRLRLGASFELRLAPTACRWILLRLRPSGWELERPSRACISLVDWLAQVRSRVS